MSSSIFMRPTLFHLPKSKPSMVDDHPTVVTRAATAPLLAQPIIKATKSKMKKIKNRCNPYRTAVLHTGGNPYRTAAY